VQTLSVVVVDARFKVS